MNERVKQLWVDALRSGQFKQGALLLAANRNGYNTRYCCMGVLCEIAASEGITEKQILSGVWCSYDLKTGFLPDSIVKWAQLPNCNPFVEIDGLTASLSKHNDEYMHSFSKIAKAIEEQL